MRRLVLVIAIWSFGFVYPALAETKSTVNLSELEQILIAAGLEPEMEVSENDNEPYALVTANGYNFDVRAKQCIPEGCQVILFFSNFDLGRDITQKDYRAVNTYNDSNLHGRAYVYEAKKRVGIDFVLDLRGGVDTAYIQLNARRFPGLVQEFVDHFRDAMSDN